MDTYTFYHRTVEAWADRVNEVYPDQWSEPTPCREWSVRDLVNHVVGEDRWTVPLVNGATLADVGDSLDGDLLGDDPVGTALKAASAAATAVADRLPAGGNVHLSYGDVSIDDYVRELACDHLLHTWDLAVAIGADPRADPHLLTEAGLFLQGREELLRSAGRSGRARPRTVACSPTCSPRWAATPSGDPRTPRWRGSQRRSAGVTSTRS